MAPVACSVANDPTVYAGHGSDDLRPRSHCWQRSGQPTPTRFFLQRLVVQRLVVQSPMFRPPGGSGKWLAPVARPWMQVMGRMTCTTAALPTPTNCPPTPCGSKPHVSSTGRPGKNWLVPLTCPVANNATVDAGHPIHDQRRWQVALRFNVINERVSKLI